MDAVAPGAPRPLGGPLGDAPHVEVLVLPVTESEAIWSAGYWVSVGTLARLGDLRILLSEQLGYPLGAVSRLVCAGRELPDEATLRDSGVTIPGPAARRAGKRLELSFDIRRQVLQSEADCREQQAGIERATSLVAALGRAEPLECKRAAEVLATMNPDAISAGDYPSLLRALGHSALSVHTAVFETLFRLGRTLDAGALSELLVPELRASGSPAAVARLMSELATTLEPVGDSAVEALRTMLRDANWQVGWHAVKRNGACAVRRSPEIESDQLCTVSGGDIVRVEEVVIHGDLRRVWGRLDADCLCGWVTLEHLDTGNNFLRRAPLEASRALGRLHRMDVVEAACVELLRESDDSRRLLAIDILQAELYEGSPRQLMTGRSLVALDKAAKRDTSLAVRRQAEQIMQPPEGRPFQHPFSSPHAELVFRVLRGDGESSRAAALALGSGAAADGNDVDAALEALYMAAQRDEGEQSVRDAAVDALDRLGSSLAVRVVTIRAEDFAPEAREIKISCVGIGGEELAALWVPAFDVLRDVRARLVTAMGVPDYRLRLVLPDGTLCAEAQEGRTIDELV